MTATPEIAIIEPNTLTCIGLQTLIEEMMPFATVRSFNSFEQLIHQTCIFIISSHHKRFWNIMPFS